jgi:hypothetical protein
MEATQCRERETFLRTKDFSATHTDRAVVPVWPQLEIGLNEVIAELDSDTAAEAARHGSALQGTDMRGIAREALRDAVERVVRSARAIDENQARLRRQLSRAGLNR